MSQILVNLLDCCEGRGLKFSKAGKEFVASCPFHNEGKRPNFRLNPDKNSWFCDVCGIGGGVVEFLAKMDNRDKKEVFKELAQKQTTQEPQNTFGKLVASYDYVNRFGDVVYQVCRYEPKTFRQRHRDQSGAFKWGMEGVERVLYRLNEILSSKTQYVWVVEGEKDVETLRGIQMVATCNVGGAGKWCDAYSQCLKGKHVVLCGDNDDPGRKHMEKVAESVEQFAESVRRIEIPAPFKDISDFAASCSSKSEFAEKLAPLFDTAPVMMKGASLPIKSMAELELEYIEHVKNSQTNTVDLSRWIPSLRCVRNLVSGELVSIVGDTGTAKTYVLQHIAMMCQVPTLLFELELPNSLTFERFVCIANSMPGQEVHESYAKGSRVAFSQVKNVFTCSKSKISPQEIESIILKSELRMGVKPALVLVDYVQLIEGKGKSRYERSSDVAEQMKIVAKNTGTVVIMASQVGRDKESPEIGLHDAKDSGSIENSSGVVIGIWRDPDDYKTLMIKVVKNTKGGLSKPIPCTIDISCMRIQEKSIVETEGLY